jgi:hypothetical protein
LRSILNDIAREIVCKPNYAAHNVLALLQKIEDMMMAQRRAVRISLRRTNGSPWRSAPAFGCRHDIIKRAFAEMITQTWVPPHLGAAVPVRG